MAATKQAQLTKQDTKFFITLATLQLLGIKKSQEKPLVLQELTISKICERAGLSRMAFYRHFKDINQVIYDYYQPKIAKIFNSLGQDVPSAVKLDNQLTFFETFQKDLTLAESQGYEPIIRQIFTRQIEQFYADIENPYLVTFLAAGTYALWQRWLLMGQDIPLRELHDILRKISALSI